MLNAPRLILGASTQGAPSLESMEFDIDTRRLLVSGLNQRKDSGAGKGKKRKPEEKGKLPGYWGWVLKYV